MSAVLTAPASEDRFVVPGEYPVDTALLGNHPLLLDLAQAALARRRDAYPALVGSGKMPEAEAAADIAAWTLLAAEWAWICSATGQHGQQPPRWTLFDRIDAVELAIERTSAALAAAPTRGGQRDLLHHQRDLYRAMHHHLALAQHGGQRSHNLAQFNHLLRARAQGLLLCSTCERRQDDPATIVCTRTDCGIKQREAA